jgi:HSP20 family protein
MTRWLKELAEDTEISYCPKTDIFETKDEFVLKLELPGVKKGDVKITFENNTLTIAGEKKKEGNGEELKYQETCFGKFERSFAFPMEVDANKGKADFKDGILTIVLPKKELTKTKEIEIEMN